MNKIDVYSDGGAKHNGNPEKREAYGSYKIIANDFEYHKKKEKYSNESNNQAEYIALINALKYVKNNVKNKPSKSIIAFVDSQLIIGQISQNWQVKAEHLKPLQEEASVLVKELNVKLVKVPREVLVKELGH